MLQYQDYNVGPADYKHLKEDELLITNVWLAIQGEGPLAGTVSVFIRLAGCNRGIKEGNCEFCDTNFLFGNGKVYTVEQLVSEVRLKYAPTFHYNFADRPLVVITGGEPMIQDNVVRLVEGLYEAGYRTQIESNGDRLARGYEESDACKSGMLVVSPKIIPSKKMYRRLDQKVFKQADALKFVVEADKASPYHELPEYLYDWIMYKGSTKNVYVSPITAYLRPVNIGEVASVWTDGLVDRETTAKNYTFASQLAIKNGYSVSVQTHTFLGVE